MTTTSYWVPKLSKADVLHLKGRGLFGASIKGSPYSMHLKQAGVRAALCGKEPGKNAPRSSKRAGWYLFAEFESPGRPTCEKCLQRAEALPALPPTEVPK